MAKNTLTTDDARDQHGNPAGILEQANDIFDETVALRRELHKWPELGNHLPRTRDAVLAALQGLPLDITLHETTSGIAAMLTGDKPGDTVLIRGDMDALPMPEDTSLEFKSNVENAMHACGHDTHTAMLVGAAKLLSSRKADITGRVLFMFQPGEEGFNGASEMLNEGLLDVGTESPITGAYAIHSASNIPGGFIGLKGGTIMASSDTMVITVRGRGGHAGGHAGLQRDQGAGARRGGGGSGGGGGGARGVGGGGGDSLGLGDDAARQLGDFFAQARARVKGRRAYTCCTVYTSINQHACSHSARLPVHVSRSDSARLLHTMFRLRCTL